MFRSMSREVLFSFALALFLLGPALCQVGLLEHPCGACPERVACAHEEDCSDDPCSDAALSPAPRQSGSDISSFVHVLFAPPAMGCVAASSEPLAHAPQDEPLSNNSAHESHLPLLI